MSTQGDIRKWFSKARAKPVEEKNEVGGSAKELQASPNKISSGTKSPGKESSLVTPSQSVLQKSQCDTFGSSKSSFPTGAKASAMKEKRKRPADDGDDDANDEDDDLDFVAPKKIRHGKVMEAEDEEETEIQAPKNKKAKGAQVAPKDINSAAGRGEQGGARGGRAAGGRGGRGGRGAFFMQSNAPPPHKGEKEIPEGPEDALAGLTFVITGTLDSLEREEAEDLIKRHGGRLTGSVSKKTSYLLSEEDESETAKARKARDLGVKQIKEDGLLDLIRASNSRKPAPASSQLKTPPAKGPTRKEVEGHNVSYGPSKPSSAKGKGMKNDAGDSGAGVIPRGTPSAYNGHHPQGKATNGKAEVLLAGESEAWPQKYAPNSMADIVGNPSLVKQLHDWLQHWNDAHVGASVSSKGGKKGRSLLAEGLDKKAVLLSGPPGIGKTTSSRLVAQALGFIPMEVNASDSRGKSDSKVRNGIGGSTANTIKEMVSNSSISFSKQPALDSSHERAVLIMDEVDGMSGGDRGGVADLILSIKASKIPIICICNDRYSQKLKSLVNYCFCLNYRKPTKQQMAKRLKYIATKEGLQIPENALEELGERVNGDMRMALNQLQYMSLSSRSLSYTDVKNRLQSSSKDEDIRPMAACDTLMGYSASRLGFDRLLDAAMSDIDLMPLMVQENYLNHVPSTASTDSTGLSLIQRVSAAADAIAMGDLVNVQVRRYQQWQHLQFSAFIGCIIPGLLMSGRRVTLEQGERNFDRFPAWLGKNSSSGKNVRLLDELRSHMAASKATASPSWQAVRMDYIETLEHSIVLPLKWDDPDEGVKTAADLMEDYSLTSEDLETVVNISKFKGYPEVFAGVPSAVKGKLTRELKKRQKDSRVRSADLLPPVALQGKAKALPAALRQRKGKPRGKGGASAAWLDTSVMQADPDMPVSVEESTGLQGEDEEAGEEDGDDEGDDLDEDDSVRERLLNRHSESGGSQKSKRGGSSSRGRTSLASGSRGRGRRGKC